MIFQTYNKPASKQELSNSEIGLTVVSFLQLFSVKIIFQLIIYYLQKKNIGVEKFNSTNGHKCIMKKKAKIMTKRLSVIFKIILLSF